jgi:flagellar biosynthesis component FlhA
MDRIQVLEDAKTHRAREVLMHQINIDNYRLAIEEIEENHAGVPHLKEFAEHLRGLLQASIAEQDKEKVLLKVITSQLSG